MRTAVTATIIQRVVLIADHPHGDRADRELRNLGHEVSYVQDQRGHASQAIHPGTAWVIAMNTHSARELLEEKARHVGARLVWSQVGWTACREALRAAGFPFEVQEVELVESATQLALAPPVPAPRAPFVFEGLEVRIQVDAAGGPWFCAADVCAVLEHSNPTAAVAGLEPDEKGLRLVETLKGAQSLVHVNEPGLYRLVMRSDKPKAKPFQRWVTHDVLPAIRRTGSYSLAPQSAAALDVRTMAQLARSVLALTEQVEQKGRALAVAEQKIAEDAPRLEAWQHLMDSTGLVPITTAGKAYSVQPLKFFDWMVAAGHVYRDGRHLLARQDHVDAGRMRQTTATLIVNNEQVHEIRAKLTGKGMAYFAERLEQFRAACSPARRAPAPKPNGSLLDRAGVPALPGGQP
jgi:prophage antirepressor-like protein